MNNGLQSRLAYLKGATRTLNTIAWDLVEDDMHGEPASEKLSEWVRAHRLWRSAIGLFSKEFEDLFYYERYYLDEVDYVAVCVEEDGYYEITHDSTIEFIAKHAAFAMHVYYKLSRCLTPKKEVLS